MCCVTSEKVHPTRLAWCDVYTLPLLTCSTSLNFLSARSPAVDVIRLGVRCEGTQIYRCLWVDWHSPFPSRLPCALHMRPNLQQYIGLWGINRILGSHPALLRCLWQNISTRLLIGCQSASLISCCLSALSSESHLNASFQWWSWDDFLQNL